MKISTDAVLLGALAAADSPNHILDIGTGTGVISLMLAQRFPDSLITGVEIDSEASEQALENFRESPFSSRLQVKNVRFQDLTENQLFDLIVSNPPYFPDHLKSKNSKRNQALHTDALSFNELIQKSVNLLQQEGKIWIILPPRQLDDFTELAEKAGLFPYREVGVRDTGDKPVIRKILGFSRSQVIPLREELILKKENGVFSDSYRDLISGFLLGF
jgi:tRNA1Val (adenine37-N6)-methyltransferase